MANLYNKKLLSNGISSLVCLQSIFWCVRALVVVFFSFGCFCF